MNLRLLLTAFVLFGLLAIGVNKAQGTLEGRVHWDEQGNRYVDSEEILNKTYEVLHQVLDPLALQKLDIAQKAWQQFKVAECDFKINHSAESPIHPMTYNECIIVMNLERAVDLQSEIQWQMMVNPFPFFQ